MLRLPRAAGVALLAGLWLCCCCAPAAAVRSGASSFQRAAGARLRARAARLAGALRRTLGDGSPPSDLVRAARAKLGAEADHLADAGSPGAALLRSYALRAPPTVLLLPAEASLPLTAAPEGLTLVPENVEETSLPLTAAPEGLELVPEGVEEVPPGPAAAAGAAETQEAVFQSDASGRSVARMRRCRGGECEERVEVHQEAGATRAAGFQDSLPDAVQGMAREMWDVEQSLGQAGLESIVRGIFAAGRAGLRGDVAGNATGGRADTMASSTEVVVKDGRAIWHTQRCRNGKCESNVTEEGPVDGANGTARGGGGGPASRSGASRAFGKVATMPL